MFPHRIHDTLRSDARFATQRPEHHRVRRRCCIPRSGRNHFNRKQRSDSRLPPTLHASTIFIQRPYSQAPLLAKRRPQQSTRFKLRNQRLDLGPAPPPPHHSRFAHSSSAPLNAATEQSALLRRIPMNYHRFPQRWFMEVAIPFALCPMHKA